MRPWPTSPRGGLCLLAVTLLLASAGCLGGSDEGDDDDDGDPTIDAPHVVIDGPTGGVDAPPWLPDGPRPDAHASQPDAPSGWHALTVEKAGTGTGTITSVPAGISCGAVCSAAFPPATAVSLLAAPASSSIFVGWADDCSGAGTCAVYLDTPRHVVAMFDRPTVTVQKVGTGGGTVTSSPAGISCGPTCSAAFTPGSTVQLNATPDATSTFSGWSSPCSGTGPCTVTVNNHVVVQATFTASAGGCTPPCAPGFVCVGTSCVCPGGGSPCPAPSGYAQLLACCPGVGCVDLCMDTYNCGTCGVSCEMSGLGMCFMGSCEFVTPLPECVGGTPTP